ncbi:MAG TPA: STAS domain-containing protein [Herpetosiphonaceae bacterium]
MRRLWTWLTTVETADEEVRRRSQNLIFISLGVMCLCVLLIPSVVLSEEQNFHLLAIGALLSLAAIWLGRHGRPGPGSLLLVGTTGASIYAAMIQAPNAVNGYMLTLSLGIASTTLRPRQIWIVFACLVAGFLAAAAARSDFFFQTTEGIQAVNAPIIVLLMLTLLGSLGARSTEQSLRLARAENQRAQQASQALTEANASLEATVSSRTEELASALSQQQAQAQSLQASLAAQRALNEVISELSLPILPVRDDVLVAPLVGTVDRVRARQLLDTALREVQRRRAKALVLDITGVAVVDTHIAKTLMQVARATTLLGARPILVGIRPEVAQSLIGLGVTFESLGTAATLQEGLALVDSGRHAGA